MKKSPSFAPLFIFGLIVAASVIMIAAHELRAPGTDVAYLPQAPSAHFGGMMTSEWNGLARAEKNIQSLTAGQKIEGPIITDAKDKNISYFATSNFNSEKMTNMASIYRYDNTSYQFERIFKHEYATGQFPSLQKQVIPVFHVVGTDSGSLVLLVQDMNDSPGPCAEMLLLPEQGVGVRTLVSMSIENPYNGFSPYALPGDAKKDAQAKETACLEEMQR